MKAFRDKWLILVKSYLKMNLKYPANLFMKLIYVPVQMLLYVFLWRNVGKNTQVDFGYLICYYLITALLTYAYPFRHIAADVQKEVMNGEIVNYLVRPMKHIEPMIAKYCAWMCVYAVVFLPVLLFVAVYRGITAGQLAAFLLLALMGMMIQFLAWYCVGLAALYMERIRGVLVLASTVEMLVSGSLIPLSYFGRNLEWLTYCFPFRYYLYVPVQALLQEQSGEWIYGNVCGQIFWILLLGIIAKGMWYFGSRCLRVNET